MYHPIRANRAAVHCGILAARLVSDVHRYDPNGAVTQYPPYIYESAQRFQWAVQNRLDYDHGIIYNVPRDYPDAFSVCLPLQGDINELMVKIARAARAAWLALGKPKGEVTDAYNDVIGQLRESWVDIVEDGMEGAMYTIPDEW